MESIKALKSYIKGLVNQQKNLKQQRKTVHCNVPRTMTPYQAETSHYLNRYELRHLYIAYGLLRGKTVEQIEGKAKEQYNENKVKEIMQTYGEAVCVG